MTDRREFLSVLGAMGAASLPGVPTLGTQAITVEAETSVFYAHPNAERNLVRFRVHNIDVPAGRLRLFDSRNRFLGTAGLITTGDLLYGELWVPVRGQLEVVAELDLPNVRSPVRTRHTLRPRRRWILHWLTVADPVRLLDRLERLPPVPLAIELATLRDTAVMGNPFGLDAQVAELDDHLQFLRAGSPARSLERRFGIDVSPVALVPASTLALNATPIALNGTGISYAISPDESGPNRFQLFEGPDGSRVIAVRPIAGSDPRSLGFSGGGDTMSQAIERWLTSSLELLSPDYRPDTVVILSDTVEADRSTMASTVREWNARFAYPRVVMGGIPELFDTVERTRAWTAYPRPVTATQRSTPSSDEVNHAAALRRTQMRDRVTAMVAPLNGRLGTGEGLQAFAEQLAFQFEGALVFNPSPMVRTDLVTLPDGEERLVTNVPAMGYVYLPRFRAAPDAPYPEPGDAALTGQRLSVRLDPSSGAISSLYYRDEGIEWVHPSGVGLNAVDGSRLESVSRRRFPAWGTRLLTTRSTPLGNLRTTLTLFDDLPWLDITNELDYHGQITPRYGFSFAVNDAMVSWETPAGYEAHRPPIGPVAHLRWLEVESAAGWKLLFRGLDAPFVEIHGPGRPVADGNTSGPAVSSAPDLPLVSFAPAASSRYRIGMAPPNAAADERWHFGWSAEPFVAVPVPGRGSWSLPTYARLIGVDAGVMVLGIEPADRGEGAVVYLQEAVGFDRTITIRPGLLGFGSARRTDLLERPADELTVSDDGVSVPIPRRGVTAVLLSDLFVRGG